MLKPRRMDSLIDRNPTKGYGLTNSCTEPHNQQAKHNHKRVGAVVVLESTAELAKVLVAGSEDEFWVKRTDLTQLVNGVMVESKPGKKQLGTNSPNASPNSHRRVVRAAWCKGVSTATKPTPHDNRQNPEVLPAEDLPNGTAC